MSIGFNWFKSYKIHIHKGTTMFDYDDSSIEYINGGSTSHSSGNIILIQELIEKDSGKRIPTIQGEWLESEDQDLDLIDPKEMSEICQRILNGDEVDKTDQRAKFEWFKKLSDEGYYLSYDCAY